MDCRLPSCDCQLSSIANRTSAIGNTSMLYTAIDHPAIACLDVKKQIAALPTSIKTRIIAHHQQMVRVDRESTAPLEPKSLRRLLSSLEDRIYQADAVIVGDYGKGVVTQPMLDTVKKICRERGVWLSLDPKPVNGVDLSGLSLITPNRKEAFELAGKRDGLRAPTPMEDASLLESRRFWARRSRRLFSFRTSTIGTVPISARTSW